MSMTLRSTFLSGLIASTRVIWKLFAFCTLTLGVQAFAHELRWDWDLIDTNNVYFPKNFDWGTATAEYQISGATRCSPSNWSAFEAPAKIECSGNACDGWNRAFDDIKLLQQLGVNSYRFSVDWTALEPEEGVFDAAALQHYVDLCDALLKAGIKPMVTLHHFVHPLWFEQLGGFEKPDNIRYFVRFCEHVFKALGRKVPMWCTINEPGVLIFQGYIRNCYPVPTRGGNGMQRAAVVLKHLLQAHVAVYQALKKLPGGKEAQIGLAHSYLAFEHFHSWWSPGKSLLERTISNTLNSFLNDSILEFFIRGHYKFKVCGVADEEYYDARALRSLDFIGLNYYAHVFLRFYHRVTDTVHPGFRLGDYRTDMPYGFYPEGIWRAIKHVAELKVPIYITENGIADAKDDRRALWIKRYLYAVSKAIEDGYDVRGYYYWSLMDNYEWDMGYSQKFGLYEVNLETKERTLRKGAQPYVDLIARWKDGGSL